MKRYIAIGHYRNSENVNFVIGSTDTRDEFKYELIANGFVYYAILTPKRMHDLLAMDDIARLDDMRKIAGGSRARQFETTIDYIDQHQGDIRRKLYAECQPA